jgi:hypothetical protein
MKYYVVSNSELHALCVAAEITFKRLPADDDYRLEDCFEACRAKEVRFIGAADQGSSLMLWGEVKK